MRQHGVISRVQLIAVGVSMSAIDRRVRSGRLVPVFRGVYAAGHAPLTALGYCMAAVLACGGGAVLSHRSAAFVWRIGPQPGFADVTVTGGRGRKIEGIVAHRAVMEDDEVTVEQNIPVTTPARTLIDQADVLTQRSLARQFDEAEHHRLDFRGLRVIHGRRGSGRLAAVMAAQDAGSTRTESWAEEALLALCDRGGLTQPACQPYVEGHRCDFAWLAERLVVETDGWAHHRTRGSFERDRLKDAELTEAGWRVVRITAKRLERDPEAVLRQLRVLLRPARLRAAPAGRRRP